MSARIAIPLVVVIALAALIAGAVTGVVFLIVFAVIGLVAAAVAGVWAARKARSLGSHSGSAIEERPPPPRS